MHEPPEGLNKDEQKRWQTCMEFRRQMGYVRTENTFDDLRIVAGLRNEIKALNDIINDLKRTIPDAELRSEIEILKKSLQKIHIIRCHIVASGGGHWSRDVYPLVAILEESGFPAVNASVARKILEDCDCIFCKNKREADKEIPKSTL